MTGEVVRLEDSRQFLANKCRTEIREAWRGMNRRSMILGWYGHLLKKQDLFGELGYASEQDFWEREGISKTTWYRHVGLVERLAELSQEELFSMKVENAALLSKMEPQHRYDRELIRGAITDSLQQFEKRIAEFIFAHGGLPPGEQKTILNLSISRDQKVVIQSKLQVWMKDHDIKSEGEALEMLVAEYTDQLTVTGYLKETLVRLRAAASTCQDDSPLCQAVRELVQEMEQALSIVICRAINNAITEAA